MIYIDNDEKRVLGVYLAEVSGMPDATVRAALGLESEGIITPNEMSKFRRERYVLRASDKVVYFSSYSKTAVHVFLMGERTYVKIRCPRSEEGVVELIRKTAEDLSGKGLRPVESRVEDIPDFILL